MHLILDFGNTLIKCFVFDQQSVVFKNTVNIDGWQQNGVQILERFPAIEAVMISDVSGITKQNPPIFLRELPLYYCNSTLKLPFTNHYKTPKRLGADRIALMAAGALLHPTEDLLVIDLGTCITYDFKDKNNNFFGGAIAPGFSMRYKSLHEKTGQLPDLEPKHPEHWIGNTTENAIHSGVYFGIISEIEGQIALYQKKYGDLTVILVGGDAERLSKPLKNSIFAHSNFLAIGLNYILELNKSEW